MRRGAVRWSSDAERALSEIVARIAQDSPARAVAFAQRLLDKVGRLAVFPKSGRTVPELADLGPTEREVIVGGYRILYHPVDDGVEVDAVIHGRRQVPP